MWCYWYVTELVMSALLLERRLNQIIFDFSGVQKTLCNFDQNVWFGWWTITECTYCRRSDLWRYALRLLAQGRQRTDFWKSSRNERTYVNLGILPMIQRESVGSIFMTASMLVSASSSGAHMRNVFLFVTEGRSALWIHYCDITIVTFFLFACNRYNKDV